VWDAITSGWVAGQRDVSVFCADVLDVLAGQNRDRGISHSVMRDLGVRERVVFYRRVRDAMKGEVAYISEEVVLLQYIISVQVSHHGCVSSNINPFSADASIDFTLARLVSLQPYKTPYDRLRR
jgi:hypothetical protein